ncbi:ABC transporter ATP-binding protein [Phenylobacterium sp.]|jgi:putative ABC transport system ATP-binding protein|uniref:ABC transporter ATP-binding protein n=1 Tax=Phenylobacterium sp. TaxID=1871053 RepID=UPI0025CBD166|nr:ABC transporter ATP-binding protein [Phenylobacterium sp.]MCA6298097.1 ABC transporter ATP-binding protein [Phenylobacterium sp.]MCA6309700.1 ABC transporter ATP-binding protein [Phenylobacterium sp.]MCA6323571.1 ABC transporter ATP-binding protein [Phenylobacterium sp.]MCA6336190.1 ABC transporter ATP-binding protein [Phenylobacterium sp.]MCA6338935.1 ABC transporter ATP-binding protein [Phenylobacterium sp.]
MTDFIRLTDVCKSYTRGKESISIFDRLNLVIPKGDFVAIMGPSGSGKTTLLNLLGGTDRCDSGQISFDGERIEGYSEGQLTAWRARNVGFIFQFYNLMPILTAAQNVELPLLLTSLSAQRRKENVLTALKIVELADRARHKPKELSGGQQQRVAIARAIVSDPKLLLCDEPTGDLDRSTANDILSTLQLLNRELGKTIIMVTHDPEAARFATRTLHLDKGQFVEVTT